MAGCLLLGTRRTVETGLTSSGGALTNLSVILDSVEEDSGHSGYLGLCCVHLDRSFKINLSLVRPGPVIKNDIQDQ